MFLFVLGTILALLAVMLGVVYKAYSSVKPRELKRRARAGDEIARLLYRTAAYGLKSKIFIVIIVAVLGYFSYVCLVDALGVWLGMPTLVIYALIGLFFVRSKGGVRESSLWLASKLSPALAWLIERLDPFLGLVSRAVRRVFPLYIHSGLYDKQDITGLLEMQKAQPDNKIPLAEIELLQHALAFGDKIVADAMTPKRVVVSVSADSDVGPILMGELHMSGHSRFPVYDTKKDNIVGVLYLRDLIEVKQTGKVRGIMRGNVMYVHEDFSLFQTLQAFVKTQQHLFIVVNGFEEYAGIITIEDVLERVIGKLIVDEFDKYDDLRAVAAAAAKKEHKNAVDTQIEASQHADSSKVSAPTDHPQDKPDDTSL